MLDYHTKLNRAINYLEKQKGPKAVAFTVDSDMNEKRFSIPIHFKSCHIVTESYDGTENHWLIASECDITYNQAIRLLEAIHSEIYGEFEMEAIVCNKTPFDIRIDLSS